jgi:molecular chaperone DnaK
MRDKIDYGVDLGTTNSAIARMENGMPTIKKSDTLKDTVPSCVHFNKKGNILVGDPAFNVMKNDNTRALKTFETGKTNTYLEFKRIMGTTYKYESSNMGKDFTADELSAEVLKKLKSIIQDENISSIVITVPAKFLNPQKEATIKAAQLAGFKQIELLQEPVAAATAYGLTAKNKDGYWLVFDFGGGTFDAAIIKSEESILTVKDTEGDNWLGGKNLDEAIVDQIIIPYLQKNYVIDGILENTEKREILRNAVKFFAEEAKIQLSFTDTYNILSNLGDLPFTDENDIEPEIDITVTQKDMETILSPIFQKAIDITKELLSRNNLKNNDLDALIPVGGPTYSPVLRQMLKEQISDKIDTSIDPMTVVAKGAALFASTISISEEVKEASRDKTKLQLDIEYEAASVETKEWININVLSEKTTGTIPTVIYADIVRSDDAWSSGKTQIGEKAALVEVLLLESCPNLFTVNVYDEQGNKLECEPNQFSILQGIGDLDRMSVLPYNIGIGKWFETEEKDLFQPVDGLEKNKKLPATGVINRLKTRSTIRPGFAKDIILIPIYQGDYKAEGTNPFLNNWITDVIISGENLPALLPKGSEVNITIEVDRSEQMQFSAYFPLIDHTKKLKIRINQTEPPTEKYLTEEIAKAKQMAHGVNATNILEKLNTLEQQLKNEGGSADGKMKILNSLRKELLKLDEAEKAVAWPKLEQKLKNVFYELEDLIIQIKKNGDSSYFNMINIETEYQEYKKNIELIIKEKKQKEAKELIREIDDERSIILVYLIPERFLQSFNSQFNIMKWKNPETAKELINQGFLNARSDYDRKKLAEIIFAIYKEMVDPNEFKTDTLK